MKKKKNIFTKMLESKITTLIALVLLLTPVLGFGYIIYRDSSQTGEPVVGSRYDNNLEPKITEEQLSAVKASLIDEKIIKSKVVLKSATLRVYIEVDKEDSKDSIKELASTVYEAVAESLPIETYFSNDGSRKMYDLEIHVYNNSTDRSSEEFIYYEIIKSSSIEERIEEFITDAKNEDFKAEVLENLEEKLNGPSEDDEESEADAGGE